MKYAINKLTLGLALISLFSTFVSAQQGENLVPNGSFENTDGKAKKLSMIDCALGWTSPTGARADLFVPGKVQEINVPENIYGKEEARDGNNYAGIVAFSYGNKIPRTYLTAKLALPLKKGMKYCVKFYVSLAEASKYASNNIGVNFAKKPFSTGEKSTIKDVTHVLSPENDAKRINQTYAWYQICNVYEAEGGEKFITIGNFFPDDKTKSENNKKPKDMKSDQIIAAYYYLDHVSVHLLNEGEKCDCIKEEMSEYSTTVYQRETILNEKMSPKEKIESQVAFFAFGKSSITQAGKTSLDFIVEQMKENPSLKLDIIGHSDATEDSTGIQKSLLSNMSEKRTNEVIQYLTANGIQENRLNAFLKGSSVPNEENSETDEQDLKMARNRRVTFRVQE
jgi:outer membrane protein OmpA-like peptidoglycan-associated protein